MHYVPYLIVFLLGLIIGSFLNVVIHRVPRSESVVFPPSHCPSCVKRLNFWDLLPVFGFLFLRGRCRYCGASISIRYPLVELATGIIFVLVYHRFGLTFEAGGFLVLLCLLLVIFCTDLEHRRVPNVLIIIGVGVGFLWHLTHGISLFLPGQAFTGPPLNFSQALLGMALGGGVMLLILIVSRGGMGAGDVKLMALIGFYLGVVGALMTMFIGFILGGLIGVILILFRLRGRKDAIPFAPFLVVGALVEIFWGSLIWQWYFQMVGWN